MLKHISSWRNIRGIQRTCAPLDPMIWEHSACDNMCMISSFLCCPSGKIRESTRKRITKELMLADVCPDRTHYIDAPSRSRITPESCCDTMPSTRSPYIYRCAYISYDKVNSLLYNFLCAYIYLMIK